MDGRRETIYSRQVLEDHRAFYNNDRAALDYPDRINAECIWLPTRLATVFALQGRGWTVVARTQTSAILRRSAGVTESVTVADAHGPRVFPGP